MSLFGKPFGAFQKAPPPAVPGAPSAVPAGSSPAPATASAPAAGNGRLILLVDDSSMIRAAVTKTLTGQAFSVVSADSGLTGLTEWEKHKDDIKLVLSDVFMPGMDGLTFGQELRRRSRRLPIILMSSKLDDDSRWVAEEAGFRLLPKPFKDELLIELINRMLRLTYGN